MECIELDFFEKVRRRLKSTTAGMGVVLQRRANLGNKGTNGDE